MALISIIHPTTHLLCNSWLSPKLGEIWLASLNSNKGTKPGKTRPILILQAQALLDIAHPTTVIIPLTTNLINNAAPLRIRVKAQNKLKKDSDLLIDQVRAIDNKRLVQGPLTKLADDHIKEIDQALSNVVGVNSI